MGGDEEKKGRVAQERERKEITGGGHQEDGVGMGGRCGVGDLPLDC